MDIPLAIRDEIFSHLEYTFWSMLPVYGYETSLKHVRTISDSRHPWFQSTLRKIRVRGSKTFPTVLVARIPATITERQLVALFEEAGRIDTIRIVRDSQGRAAHAFITFFQFESADRAIQRKNLHSSKVTDFKPIFVDWAEYEVAERSECSKCVFIDGMHQFIDCMALYDTLTSIGAVDRYQVQFGGPSKLNVHGYVVFETSAAAKTVIEKLNGKMILGCILTLHAFKNGSTERFEPLMPSPKRTVHRPSSPRDLKPL